VITADMSI